jgi:dTDP-glucose 4,6-dehydratase
MRTVLVTGAAGFIGSNFVRHVLQTHPDWRVVVLDKLTYAGNLANLADIERQYGAADQGTRATHDTFRYRFVRGDICDRQLVNSLFSGAYSTRHPSPPTHHPLKIDVVVNFAAESHVDRSILDASAFIETNIKGTQVLLEAARQYPVDTFVQISTDEVYGALGEEGVFTEGSPLKPNSPYAASKTAADVLCSAYHKTYGVPVVITRSSNNYGPYQFPEKLVPLMIRNALVGKELPVYGEGKQVRDWLYVEDNCRAIDMVLQRGRTGEVYNIGGDCEKRNIEIVCLICEMLASELKERNEAKDLKRLITYIKDPRGAAHDFRYALGCAKLQTELGWKPKVGLKEGMIGTVRWYLKNQDWVENVITGDYQDYYEKVYGVR